MTDEYRGLPGVTDAKLEGALGWEDADGVTHLTLLATCGYGDVIRDDDGPLSAEVTNTDPAYRLLGVNAKFVKRLRTGTGTPYSVFITTGVGGNLGLGYRYSPMIGGGAQTGWRGRVALRAEIQRFKRGTTINNSTRVVMGAAVGFGE